MKLELTVPMSLRGDRVLLDALEAVQGSEAAKDLLRPILEILRRAISLNIQQAFFTEFERHVQDGNLPGQREGDVRIVLELSDAELDPARGDLLDLAVEGSEWIWRKTSNGQAAAVFEVICDILDEGLPPAEQQALLDANLADLLG